MPSKASSLNPATGPNPAAKTLFFKLDLKANGVWLFALSLLFLLAEPFVLYLTGATSVDLSRNPIWGSQLARAFADFSRGVQSFVFASLMVMGLTFLAFRLFTFLFSAEESHFCLSLPLSRTRLFANRYLAGIVLISLAFLVEFLVMLLIFFLPPANLAPYFQDWLSLRLNFFFASLAFFSNLVFCLILVGHFTDGLLVAVGLNLALPALLFLLYNFVQDSVAGYMASPQEGFSQLLYWFAPLLQLFVPRQGLMDGLQSLTCWMIWGSLSLIAFQRRPAERAGNRLSSLPHSCPLALLYTFLGGVVGGMLMESWTSQTILYFLLGFLPFACLAHLLYQVLVQGPLKGAGRKFAVKICACLVLMVAFDLAVETYPVEAPLYWQAEDLESVDLNLSYLSQAWSIREGGVMLHLDQETGPEVLAKLLKIYQEGPHLATRQGFINDSRFVTEGDRGTLVISGIPMETEFTRQGGRTEKVRLYYSDIDEVLEAFAGSELYQPLTQLGQKNYLPGDEVYLDFSLYDDGSHQEDFDRLLGDLADKPYFQKDRRPAQPHLPHHGDKVGAIPEDFYDDRSKGERKQGQASLALRDQEAEKLVSLIREEERQADDLSQLMGQAKLQMYKHELTDSFYDHLESLWPQLHMRVSLKQYRELSLPGLRFHPLLIKEENDGQSGQETDPDLQLESLHLECYLPIYEDIYAESQAYILQLLQGEAHD